MRRMQLLPLAFALSLAVPLSHAADTADTPNPKKSQSAKPGAARIDANGDGKVSYDELKARYPGVTEEKFKARDKNGDGFITPDDRKTVAPKTKPGAEPAQSKMHGHEPGQIFNQADKDANGQVTLEELHAVAPRFPVNRFRELDKNADGALTGDELARARPQAKAPEAPTNENLFARADKNKDGSATFDEIRAVVPKFTREKFDKLDKNSDSVVTANEVSKPSKGGNEQSAALLARKADVDRNGKVTYEEMLAVTPNLQRNRFDEIDTNKDGVLSSGDRTQKERDGKQGEDDGVAKVIESDADNDGNVSFEELAAAKPGYPRETFNRLDRNKDGTISGDDAGKK